MQIKRDNARFDHFILRYSLALILLQLAYATPTHPHPYTGYPREKFHVSFPTPLLFNPITISAVLIMIPTVLITEMPKSRTSVIDQDGFKQNELVNAFIGTGLPRSHHPETANEQKSPGDRSSFLGRPSMTASHKHRFVRRHNCGSRISKLGTSLVVDETQPRQ